MDWRHLLTVLPIRVSACQMAGLAPPVRMHGFHWLNL
jgi:hypothetical protein